MAKKSESKLVLTEEQDINEALKRNPSLIRFVENPTDEMKFTAVSNNGRAIQFIENASDELKMLAIKRHRKAIDFIENPTPEMMIAALQREEKKTGRKAQQTEETPVEA